MRLAVIRQRYTPYGGAERFLESALEALLERNVAISLYTRSWPQTRLQLIEPVICNPPYFGRLWRDWGFARAACKAVGKSDADLVQSHERVCCCDVYRAGDGVHATWLEQRRRVISKVERAITRVSPYHRHVLRAERRLFTSPWLRAVVCNSKMVRDDIAHRFGVPVERMHVIYNAVNSDGFHPNLRSLRTWVRERHHISDAATVYLLVGSGYMRKGVAAALKAMAQLPPTAHLMVVGRDRRPGEYAKLAQHLGVADRVTFAGPQSEPKPYYGAADVFVLPTLYDPCPNAALEAMACGLPIVTSTTSGAAELALERHAGLVCDALDVDTLASHMRSLQDPALRKRMGVHARTIAVGLTPAAMTLQLVLLYRDLLESAGAAREARTVAAEASRTRGAASARSTASSARRTDAAALPEVGAPPMANDGAAELPMRDAVIVPSAVPPGGGADHRPPDMGDAVPGREPRAR